MNTTKIIEHSHIIGIKRVSDQFNSDSGKKIENQFFTKFSFTENVLKYCFNNNLPSNETKYYHEFKMVIYQNGNFEEKDFVFFIPEPNNRIKIDDKNLTAEFIMIGILHSGSATCNPLLEVIFDSNGVFHYISSDSNYLLPMFGFYDGNSQNFSNRIKQHDVFGYFYRCNKEDYNKFYKGVQRNKKYEFDFNDDAKLSGTGGYWYHESIMSYFDNKFNLLNEWK